MTFDVHAIGRMVSGLHGVRVLDIDGTRLRVSGLEAIDGTPVVDLKPVIGSVDER